jgi:hypothetical protein
MSIFSCLINVCGCSTIKEPYDADDCGLNDYERI